MGIATQRATLSRVKIIPTEAMLSKYPATE